MFYCKQSLISKFIFCLFMAAPATGKGCWCFSCCHDENEDIHPRYHANSTWHVDYLTNPASCYMNGEQMVTYNGQKMTRSDAHTRWHKEKHESEMESLKWNATEGSWFYSGSRINHLDFQPGGFYSRILEGETLTLLKARQNEQYEEDGKKPEVQQQRAAAEERRRAEERQKAKEDAERSQRAALLRTQYSIGAYDDPATMKKKREERPNWVRYHDEK